MLLTFSDSILDRKLIRLEKTSAPTVPSIALDTMDSSLIIIDLNSMPIVQGEEESKQ
jgi:hypothetical protein